MIYLQTELRVVDHTLFQQLWSLYESVQEYKQNQERLSETNSECSSISYSLENTLETIPDYKEHVYENEKFHQHIYENQSVFERQASNSSGYYSGSSKEENVYEPVYLEPKCHTGAGKSKEKCGRSISMSSLSNQRKNSNNKAKPSRFSGIFTQTTYESSC